MGIILLNKVKQYVITTKLCVDPLVRSNVNKLVARDRGVLQAYLSAERDVFACKKFPYCFIDSSNNGYLSNYRLFVSIIGKHRVAYSNGGMRGYIVPEEDFKLLYNIISENSRAVRVKKHEYQVKAESLKSSTSEDKKTPASRSKKRKRVEKSTQNSRKDSLYR